MTQSDFDRRKFLRLAGFAGVGVAASPLLLAACGSEGATTTTLGAAGTTTTLGATGSTLPSIPNLKFLGWDFQPDQIEANLKRWTGTSGVGVDLEVIPNTGYTAALETQLRGGVELDVYYNFAYNSRKFIDQGWAQDLAGLDGVEQMLDDMFPSARARHLTDDGRVLSVPYFSATHMLHYNTNHLSSVGWDAPPATMNEVVEVCEALRAQGVAESPYRAFWVKGFAEEYLMVYLLAEGITPFGPDGEPAFADDARTLGVFEWWNTMFAEGFAPETLLTDDPGKLTLDMAEGRGSLFVLHHYFLTSIRSTEGPEAANIVQAPSLPGASGDTLQIGEVVQMGLGATGDRQPAAWDLLKFYGWKDEAGEYSVLNDWATAAGLGAPYPDFWASDTIRETFPDYYDLSMISDTFAERSDVVPARTLSWYQAFQTDVGDIIHTMLLGERTPRETVDALAVAAVDRAAGKGDL